jgi:hypothetical protein
MMMILEGKLRRAAILLSLPAAAFAGYWAWQKVEYPDRIDVCFSASPPYYLRSLGEDCDRWARTSMGSATKGGGTVSRASLGAVIYNNNGLTKDAFSAIADEWVADYKTVVFKHSMLVLLYWIEVLVIAGLGVSAVWLLAFSGSWVLRG